MAFIEVNNLTHIYGKGTEQEFCALKDVSFTIEEGEFVAILGANGSGKSTLARHLNGLLLPTEGECMINGLDTKKPEDIWTIRRQVGMVFQNPDNQLIAGVVEDDVAFGPENIGMEPSKIRQCVSIAKAPAIATRCFCPPDKRCGANLRKSSMPTARRESVTC